MSSNEALVLIERRGDVAVVRLNRPEARNAMNAALAQATIDAIDSCQDAGAIVLTGTDPAFCAGLDLRDLGVPKLSDLPRFTGAAVGSGVPVIAAVNGPAVTGGFELALACDVMVASDKARFADTHLRVGVYPGPVLVDLPRRVGPAWAREMSLTGNFVDAETALRIGLVNHVVAHADLVPFTLALAASIAEQPRQMVVAMRED
ncbi:MAG: enoyl-CoA hydratase-related protein, partial [Ilumatobacteraceae bacterium]